MAHKQSDYVNELTHPCALIAHELRAPLTIVHGYIELLARPLDDNARTIAVTAALRAVGRLNAAIDDLLTHSPDAPIFTPKNIEQFSLRELAEEIIVECAPLSGHQMKVGGDVGLFSGDRALFRQAVANLLSNAIKHSPIPGHIEIEITEGDDEMSLVVQDDGPGVPEDARERVFGLFERLEAGPNATEGLGLGLPVARMIISAHEGTVSLEPSDQGARFRVVLPVAK